MKLALILSALLLSTAARAEGTAYVDVTRVYQDAAESKRITAELQRDHDTKQAELTAASDAVTKAQAAKAKPADLKVIQDRAAALAQTDEAAWEAHVAAATKQKTDALAKVVAKLKKDRHLATVLPVVPIDPAPGSDLTAEVIKRWDAAATPTAEEVAALKAQVAQLQAERAALTKPVAPAVPPAPPTAPALAAKGKK